MQTTVKGYHILRVHPRMGELERWAVDWKRNHYGYIIKAVYKGHIGEKPVVFWFCRAEKQVGYRRFINQKVANTRTQIVLELAAMREGRKVDATDRVRVVQKIQDTALS